MADQKVVTMKLNVDLNCTKCYKKVKKALCKFPEIRDEYYDEKTNTVFIRVVCNDPEKLMNKLCYKGDGSIKSIVILEPPKPSQLEHQKAPAQDPTPVPVPVQAPVPAPQPVPIWQPYPIPIPIWQPCHCGPYCEAQYCRCYGRPVYENWEGGRQCCHECMYSQGCSIL